MELSELARRADALRALDHGDRPLVATDAWEPHEMAAMARQAGV